MARIIERVLATGEVGLVGLVPLRCARRYWPHWAHVRHSVSIVFVGSSNGSDHGEECIGRQRQLCRCEMVRIAAHKLWSCAGSVHVIVDARSGELLDVVGPQEKSRSPRA